MSLSRITPIFLNITALSRLIYNLTLISFVFLVGFMLEEEQVNRIFTTLAIIQMTASFMSFGFGANIIKPLLDTPNKQRNSVVLHIILLKIGFVLFATILIEQFNLLNQISPLVVFLTLLGSVWSFADIYVELMSLKRYKQYFVLKAILSVFSLALKFTLIKINVELLYYFLTIEGLFPLAFFLLTHVNKDSTREGVKIVYFKQVYKLIRHGIFIWSSSFLQIGGSRLLYLIINVLVPYRFSAFYYIFLRLVEGLMFIPNNICASFFKKIINKQYDILVQEELRYKMLTNCLLSSIIASPALFVVLYLYSKFKDITIENYFLLLPIIIGVTVLSFVRIWISREIVLNENLIASPISYTFGFLFTMICVYFLANHGMWIVISLLVYYLVCSIVPFTIYSSRMKSTYKLLKKLCHV
ncbi:hypothetical protein [uncultured Algibacter sp.]|uniref:hypothetical protein n=1 Tax=uncultured Algibacter sp. TaxID=298659 RepID=UPI0026302A85|nr:hypothetical protein [uncultured Algibacter sp.]